LRGLQPFLVERRATRELIFERPLLLPPPATPSTPPPPTPGPAVATAAMVCRNSANNWSRDARYRVRRLVSDFETSKSGSIRRVLRGAKNGSPMSSTNDASWTRSARNSSATSTRTPSGGGLDGKMMRSGRRQSSVAAIMRSRTNSSVFLP
jgi:hypothetical protein